MNDQRRSDKEKRPRYVAPPRVVYTPAKPVGILEYAIQKSPEGSARMVAVLMDIIEETAPLPSGRQKDIRHDVLELWRDLTSEKSTRQADYIGEPARLAAYLRYFLPWNVVRLVPILAGLDLGLKPGDTMLDIGSGPLTVPIALWIARPELRGAAIRIDCIDRVKRVMDIGLAILEGLALRTGQPFTWSVKTGKASFNLTPDGAEHERYSFVSAANVFNESFWKQKGSLGERAESLAEALGARTVPDGRVLIVEPGDPRSGAMMAALRESVILAGGKPLAPCPHDAACPMAGAFLSSAFRKDDEDAPRVPGAAMLQPVVTARGRSKAPWCHFVIEPSAAPERLIAFSESAGLPKDRLIASWLLLQPLPGTAPVPTTLPTPTPAGNPARQAAGNQNKVNQVRIISDAFRLPDGAGRYACTRTGYTLVRGSLADLPSGSLALLDSPVPPATSYRDPKSNAIVITAHSDAILHAPIPVPRNVPAARKPREKTPENQKTKRATRFNGRGKPRRST